MARIAVVLCLLARFVCAAHARTVHTVGSSKVDQGHLRRENGQLRNTSLLPVIEPSYQLDLGSRLEAFARLLLIPAGSAAFDTSSAGRHCPRSISGCVRPAAARLGKVTCNLHGVSPWKRWNFHSPDTKRIGKKLWAAGELPEHGYMKVGNISGMKALFYITRFEAKTALGAKVAAEMPPDMEKNAWWSNAERICALLENLAPSKAVAAEAEDVEMLEASTVYEYTVEQLIEQKKLLKSQGKSDDHPDVCRITCSINEQQQAKLAEKPGHVRVAKAEREVRLCKVAVETAESKGASLQEALTSLQQQIAENANAVAKSKEQLAEAERQRDELYKSLQLAGGSSDSSQQAEVKRLVYKYPSYLDVKASEAQLKMAALQEALGLSKAELKKMIWLCRDLISLPSEKVSQKLAVLRKRLDLSDTELRKVLVKSPSILTKNPHNNILPSLDKLQEVLELSNAELKKCFLLSPELMSYSMESKVLPTLASLQEVLGLTKVELRKLVLRFPRVLLFRFEANVLPKLTALKQRLDLSVAELKYVVVMIPQVTSYSTTEKVMPSLLAIQKRLALSDAELKKVVLGQPTVLCCNMENNVLPKLATLRHRLGLSEAQLKKMVLQRPILMSYSMEKRYVPRLKLCHLLGANVTSVLIDAGLSDEKFCKKINASLEDLRAFKTA